MPKPELVTVDDVLDLELSGRSQAEIAETLVDWSTSVSTLSDDVDSYSPASLLVSAAEHLEMGGLDGADALLDRATQAAGHEQVDFFEPRVANALGRGDLETARAIEESARRGPVHRHVTYEMMADILDTHGESERGLRWSNIGLRRLERVPDAEAEYEHLLFARYHMRRRHGMNLDGYDREAAEILADREDDEG